MASAWMQACSSFSQRIKLLREATLLELLLRDLSPAFGLPAVKYNRHIPIIHPNYAGNPR